MNKTLLLEGFRWMFILLVACVIILYGYQRFLLHSSIETSLQTVAPDSTIIGIIQTHTTDNKEKVYKALYKTKDGKCYRASFERKKHIFIRDQEESC
ncbi:MULTISPECIES: hypothetical protein [unclassified Rossellomorea]|uniref:hypothetical protein n=1 Tax=unclassified Rossellomorea TaxID=2837526 RepID=UPI00261CD264|nr:hypothetical protein [uncultured Rossellomorea sp.]